MEPINPSNVPVATPKKGKRGLGLFLIIWPFVGLVVVMVAYAIVGYFATQNVIIGGSNPPKPFELAIIALLGFLGIICVLGLIIGIPLGLYFISKSGGASKFSMKEAIKFGWETMKKKFWLFFAVLITMFAVNVISSSLGFKVNRIYDNNNQIIIAVIISIIFGVIQAIVGLGAMSIALKLVDGKEAKYADLFSVYKLFFKYLAGSILYTLIVIVGYILLIVPGIIWQFKYLLYPYFLLEGAGPIEALRKSGQATKGAKADLFVFCLLLGLIGIAGFIAILVGLFFAIPTVMVAMSFVYRKLQSKIVVESSSSV